MTWTRYRSATVAGSHGVPPKLLVARPDGDEHMAYQTTAPTLGRTPDGPSGKRVASQYAHEKTIDGGSLPLPADRVRRQLAPSRFCGTVPCHHRATSGKAVGIGHSCAAVTHQSKPPPDASASGQSQFRRRDEGEGRGRGLEISSPEIRALQPAPNAESEHLTARASLVRRDCARRLAKTSTQN